MSRFYRTPEAALKRAQEKCEQNERVAAVTSLHNLLTSRRVKVWSQTMEDVMMLYIDLCVELKKVNDAVGEGQTPELWLVNVRVA